MTTEYILQEGDTHESLARDLLEQAEHPDQVVWSPRPDVYGGGVYLLADSSIAERVREARAARRAEEAQRALVDNAEVPAGGDAEDAEDEGSEPGEAEEADADEGPDAERLTPAQKRARAREAKKQAEAEAAADEEKSE